MDGDGFHFFIVAGVLGAAFLAVWWLGNGQRRRYMAAQTTYLEEQTAALKRNDAYLAASKANGTTQTELSAKQVEILERIARALESKT
jgi:hypothetical protein